MLHDVFQNPEFVCFYASATVLREFLHIFFFFFFCDLMASRSREHIIDIQFWHKGQHGLEDELIRLWRSKVYNQRGQRSVIPSLFNATAQKHQHDVCMEAFNRDAVITIN